MSRKKESPRVTANIRRCEIVEIPLKAVTFQDALTEASNLDGTQDGEVVDVSYCVQSVQIPDRFVTEID